jgi:cytochrome b
MQRNPYSEQEADRGTFKVLVWDLPTRLFHWLLVGCLVVSFLTAVRGGNAMSCHLLSGCAILALLLFRVAWGFAGSRTSRFVDFVKGPAAVCGHVRGVFATQSGPWLGHNPLGGWSVLLMLLLVAVQVGTGLFASDDIFTEGPLYPLVERETAGFLTRVHQLNRYVLIGILGVHVLAVAFYFFVKREDLLTPMITGKKRWHSDIAPAVAGNARAVVIFTPIALGVYWLLC